MSNRTQYLVLSPWLAIYLPFCLLVVGILFGFLFRCENKGNTFPWNIFGPLELQSVTTQKTAIFGHHCQDFKCNISLNEWIRGWPRPVLAPQPSVIYCPWHNLSVYWVIWFQYNSTPHFSCQMYNWLSNNFLDMWIGCWNHIMWPPHSFHLSPLHFLMGMHQRKRLCYKSSRLWWLGQSHPSSCYRYQGPTSTTVHVKDSILHCCKACMQARDSTFSSSCEDTTQNNA
jgi:hypothetical protein